MRHSFQPTQVNCSLNCSTSLCFPLSNSPAFSFTWLMHLLSLTHLVCFLPSPPVHCPVRCDPLLSTCYVCYIISTFVILVPQNLPELGIIPGSVNYQVSQGGSGRTAQYFAKYSRSIFLPLSIVDPVLVMFHGALGCTREYVSWQYSTNTVKYMRFVQVQVMLGERKIMPHRLHRIITTLHNLRSSLSCQCFAPASSW